MSISRTCWVTIRAWQRGDDFTSVLLEKGFAEWTRRPGFILPIEKYTTLRSVIHNREVGMGTLQGLEHDWAEYEWLAQRGGQSYLMVPLVERGIPMGVVKLIDQHQRFFDEDEVRLAVGIANVVSNAMENARLYQSLDSRARALESAYRELQQADKAKDEFLQNVSHELRTPLISVLGYGGLLAEGQFGPINHEQQEALGTVMQKAQKLADIVEDIVSLQAMETRAFDRKPIDLVALVREIVAKDMPRAQALGLELKVHSPENLPPVLVDSKTISDAFEKLLDNAIKFGGDGKCVEVTLQDTDGPMLQVMVRDYGIGIDVPEQQKIFQRFYQVDGGTARRYGGTGIGLAIAKSIIDGHGGRIGVKSKLGEGATFIFTLPKYGVFNQQN
jgi:signal transduction histidine kinase